MEGSSNDILSNVQKTEWDDLSLGHYTDDNALYVWKCISHGQYEITGANPCFLTANNPPDWTHKDLLVFLIKAKDEEEHRRDVMNALGR